MHKIQQCDLLVLHKTSYHVAMSLQKSYCFTTITFLLISVSIQTQSFSIGDDRKKHLLQEIKPTQNQLTPSFNEYKSSRAIRNDDLSGIKKNYQPDSVQSDNKYNTEALMSSMKNIDLFKIENGTETKVVISGGKKYLIPVKESDHIHDKLSQRQRLQGIMLNVTTGGLNLSGWKKKKLSKKTKAILQNVYKMEVESD